MNTQKKKPFILALFESLVFKQLSQIMESGETIQSFLESKSEDAFGYQNQIEIKILILKNQIRNIFVNLESIAVDDKLARVVINSLMLLNKDVYFLLQEGILNLYMDLIETKKKQSELMNRIEVVDLIQKIINQMNIIMYEFFTFHQFKKSKHQFYKQRKIKHKSFPVRRARSYESDGQTSKSKNSYNLMFNASDIQKIHIQFSQLTINQLLENYLQSYQSQVNSLEQVCKICSKNILISSLQEHVQNCQKKYMIKQDIKHMNSQLSNIAYQLLEEYNINSQLYQLQNTQSLQNEDDRLKKHFIFILNNIINTHKPQPSTHQTSKYQKINSQQKILDNLDKFQQLKLKIEEFLLQCQNTTDTFQVERYIEHITIVKQLHVKLNQFYEGLKTLQTEYINQQQDFGSSSTIGGRSYASNKKSRFAATKNPSKNSSQKDSFEEIINDQMGQKQKKLQDQQFETVLFNPKSRQSIGTHLNKNVQFQVNDDDQGEQPQPIIRSKSVKSIQRKLRKVKSLVIFDQSQTDSQAQSQRQYYNNQSSDNSIKQQNIDLKDFQILKFIGKGAFGKVYAVRKNDTDDLYALKMINVGQHWGEKQFQQIKNQHEIFKKIAGQHLVKAPYCFSQGTVHIFMMQFMAGGDLGKILQEQTYLQEARAKQILAEIVLAIQHLHNAQIIHRDLKPENLVIDQKGHLKLTDFGLSQIQIQGKLSNVIKKSSNSKDQSKQKKKYRRQGVVTKKQKIKLIGTPDYIAPQIINGVSTDNKSIDWWSLGVMAYEIMVGVRPFCGNTIEDIVQNILRFNIEWPEIGNEEGMISENAYDFIKKLLNKDFINRLGANGVDEIKAHPFFDGINWTNVKIEPNMTIAPHQSKVRQLLQMAQDMDLRKQLEQKTGVNDRNIQMPRLDNFVRFDILGQNTVKSANKAKVKKAGTLKRLKSIKDIICQKNSELPLKQNLPSLSKKSKSNLQWNHFQWEEFTKPKASIIY